MTLPLPSHVTPRHAQQLAVSEVVHGNVQPATPPPSRPLEKPSRALRSPRLQELELWFRELTGDRKSRRTKTDKHRKKRRGHVVVRCIKKCSIEARMQSVRTLGGEEGFLLGLFRT